jgi:hypothetical protein
MAQTYEYWGVYCNCGDLHPLRESESDDDLPDVGEFTIFCSHIQPGSARIAQYFYEDNLIRVSLDEPVPNFHRHPQFP